MNDRFVELLNTLCQHTERDSVSWHETANGNAFRVAYGQGVVRIEKLQNRNGVSYSAVLLNREGRELESEDYFPHEANPEFGNDGLAFLQELFTLARRAALRVDDLLTSMEKGLAKGEPADPPPLASSNPDDDIPF